MINFYDYDYILRWLEGNREFRQETDVHYRSVSFNGHMSR